MLYSIGNVIIECLEEVDIVKGIEAEEHDLEARVEDAIEVGRQVLQKVDLNFLQSDELIDGHGRDVIGEHV